MLVVLAAGAPFNVAEERDPVRRGTVSGVYPEVVPPATGANTVGDPCRCADRYEPATQCGVHDRHGSTNRRSCTRESRMLNVAIPAGDHSPVRFVNHGDPASNIGHEMISRPRDHV